MRTLARALVVAAVMVAALGTGALAAPDAAVASGSAAGAAAANATPEPSPGAEPELPAQDDAEPSPQPTPEPSPQPSPSPGAEPTPPPEDNESDGDEEGEDSGGAGEECQPWELNCHVVQAFRAWIAETVADFVNAQMMGTAMALMLMTPPTSGIQSVWSSAQAIVNVGFVLVVTLAGVLVMGYQSAQTSTGIKEVAPRLLLAFVAANASWFLTQQLGHAGNAVSLAVVGDSADADSVTNTFERFLDAPAAEGIITVQLMLLGSVAGIIVLFTVMIRIMLWILLTAAAPLALAAHALPQTEGLARLWWRAIGALLIMQIAQALAMRVVMTLFLARDSLDMFDPLGTAGSVIDLGVLVACLYVLIRIPFWAGKQVFNYQRSPLVKGAKLAASLLVFKGLGLGKTAGAAGSKATRTTAKAKPPRTPSPATTGHRPVQRPRWSQPELPGVWPRVPRGRQDPLPGIDRQIDPAAQQRLRERQRWVQPPLPSGQTGRPRWHRQEALPGMEGHPQGRQDPLPDLKVPPQTRTEPLFPVTEQMRRQPLHRVPRAEPHGTPHERRRQPLPPLPPPSARSGESVPWHRPVRPRPRRRPPHSDNKGNR